MRFARRKWGWYFTLLSRKRFKIKLLCFRKGRAISMQRHFKRHELWLFLNGEGEWADEQEHITLKHGGGYWHIPAQTWHQYRALKRTFVIEIQYGVECDEGDIERAFLVH